MRIVFMGTPTFAVSALRTLAEDGQEIALVLTQPDKPKGRGHASTPSEVKQYASAQGLRVETPATLRSPEAQQLLREVNADLFVVAAYGKILPKAVLEMPKYGCVNVHASLLPAWRGAAPIQRAVMAGDTVGGVTMMYMDEGLDTGDIILQRSMDIPSDMTAGEYHDALCELSAEALRHFLRLAENGSIPRQKQPASFTYAAKIEKEETYVSFRETAKQTVNRIRGLEPFPCAFALLNGKRIKLHQACIEQESGVYGEPGTLLSAKQDGITVACADGCVRLLSLQPEGKGRMDAFSFANGLQNKDGLRFQ